MKKILLLLSMVLLVSCGMSNQEKIDTIKFCNDNGFETYTGGFGDVFCSNRKIETKVDKCIEEYTRGISEKYDDPNHVTNLREDEYSNVVRTCNDVFGDKK